ncbi:hypothetical protein DPMN_080998 [Dreissena polymorpha]|uniref:Uncharacterized protein n=1 Tax=Dreissena polymorpha TaxID=45954 RepID=A0A9D4BG51_DREPO|nr:hypothetical protein DPMN_080998 [Dreissena polymorpha]
MPFAKPVWWALLSYGSAGWRTVLTRRITARTNWTAYRSGVNEGNLGGCFTERTWL